MALPLVIKEFEPIFGDSYATIRVRLLSREGRRPVLDLRWFDRTKNEFKVHGISIPVKSLDNLRHILENHEEEILMLSSLTPKKETSNA